MKPNEELVNDLALALRLEKDYAFVIIAEALDGRPELLQRHGFEDLDQLKRKVGGMSKQFENRLSVATKDFVNELIVETNLLRPVNFITNLLVRLLG